jgi:CBS domain containing-hemolysin-like protein
MSDVGYSIHVMLELTLAGICALIVAYLVLLLRSFEYLSLPELKRQARSGDKKAKAVYQVRGSYGSHVFVLLWSLIGIFSSTMVVLFESVLWSWFAVLLALPVTVLVHAILPWSKYPAPSLGLASSASTVIYRILLVTGPLFTVVEKLVGSWISRSEVNRLNSKEELLEVLRHTKIEADPFSKDELAIAEHALTFGNKQIGEIMTPRSVIKVVRSEDVLSPALMSELHESGFSRFPVIETEHGQFVGILYAKDLYGSRTSRLVRDVMDNEVYYVNEFTALDQVLNAFLRTKHHLFMVVNEFEEIVGVISIEDVLEQIIGRDIIDEFDQYEDLRVVAKQRAQDVAEHRKEHTI